MKGNLIVLVGPSGVGKGTVLKKVFEKLDRLIFSVSATTREMRPGEVDGVNYFFCSKESFLQKVQNSEFIEWAEFVGNYYGTPKDFVENKRLEGNDVILEIEVEGAKQVKKVLKDAIFIFIAPPSIDALYQRLKERSTESDEKIMLRIEKSKQELKEIDWFDYSIVNEEGKADETAEKLIEIIKRHRA
jgi:guanylate kinase